MKAFREEPPEEGATSDELEHMNFFLNVAMPVVDPTVLKATAWSNNGSNHVDFFQSTYQLFQLSVKQITYVQPPVCEIFSTLNLYSKINQNQ